MFTLGMEQLVTAAAIAALLVVVHAVFAVYLYRILSAEPKGDGSPTDAVEGFSSAASEEASRREQESDHDGADEGSTVPCPTCGARNDPSFQFCRHCVSQLSNPSVSQTDTAKGSSG
jgi:hypothetical protein